MCDLIIKIILKNGSHILNEYKNILEILGRFQNQYKELRKWNRVNLVNWFQKKVYGRRLKKWKSDYDGEYIILRVCDGWWVLHYSTTVLASLKQNDRIYK